MKPMRDELKEAHGYEIGQVPRRQAFIDTYSTDPFVPFAQVPSALGER